MQMLWSDWLSHCILSAISVQWLELVYEMATFYRFGKVSDFDENGYLKSREVSIYLNEGRL